MHNVGSVQLEQIFPITSVSNDVACRSVTVPHCRLKGQACNDMHSRWGQRLAFGKVNRFEGVG